MVLGTYFGITGITFLLFCVFVIACLGYALGRVTIKGVSLGTAGVFVVALLFGWAVPALGRRIVPKTRC